MGTGKDAAPRTAQGPIQNCFPVAFVLFLVATSVTVIQYKVPTIMVPLMEQFSLDSYTASWLMSVFTFVGIVCSLPAGMACRKIGPKRLILFAVALALASSVCGAFASHVGVLLVTRALEGVSLVCVIACGPVIIQTCVAPERVGTASGIWMLGGMLGATIAGVLTPVVYGGFGFRGLWLGYAAFAGVAGLIFAFAIRVPKGSPLTAGSKSGRIDRTVFLKGNTLRFFVPALLLGPDLSQWTLCAVALCGIGLAGAASMASCRFE